MRKWRKEILVRGSSLPRQDGNPTKEQDPANVCFLAVIQTIPLLLEMVSV